MFVQYIMCNMYVLLSIVSHDNILISSNVCTLQSSSNSDTRMEAEGYPYFFEKLQPEEEATVRAHFLSNSTSRDLGRYFLNS